MNTIAHAIKKAGTQEDLARICGVSQSAVSQWATAQSLPSPKYVALILRELGVDLRSFHPEVFYMNDHTLPPFSPEPKETSSGNQKDARS